MHAAGAGSLDTRPAGEGALELDEGTRDLVTHCSMTFMVVNWACGGVASSVMATSSPSRLGCGSSRSRCASDRVTFGSRASVAAA